VCLKSDTRHVGTIAYLQVVFKSPANLELGMLYVFKTSVYYIHI